MTIDTETIIDICAHILYYRGMYKETMAEEYLSDERFWTRKLNDCITPEPTSEVWTLRKFSLPNSEQNPERSVAS